MDPTSLDHLIQPFTITDITSNLWVYIGILVLQLILMFRRSIAKFLDIRMSYMKRLLDRRLTSPKEELNHCPYSPYINPVINAKKKSAQSDKPLVKMISYHDIHGLDSPVPSVEVMLDELTEVRYRFAIFNLTNYADVPVLMAKMSQLNIDIIATTIIYKNEMAGLLMFYVSYYGKRLLTESALDKTEPSPVLFDG